MRGLNCTPEEGNKACCQTIQNHNDCCNYICCPHQDACHPERCAVSLIVQDSLLNLLQFQMSGLRGLNLLPMRRCSPSNIIQCFATAGSIEGA